jgi:hypothetical protein
MNTYLPYTYLIGWSALDTWYYGCRYSEKQCVNPSDLWISYFTSSEYVKQFREIHGEPDIIQIRKTFNSAKQTLDWEHKVLRRLKVTSSSKWLNKTDNKCIMLDEDVISKIVQKNKGRKRKPCSDSTKRKISESNKGKIAWNKGIKDSCPSWVGKRHKEESKEKMRRSKLGKCQSSESNQKRSDSLKGRIITPEHREKLRLAAIARYNKS